MTRFQINFAHIAVKKQLLQDLHRVIYCMILFMGFFILTGVFCIRRGN